ncbi:MAG: flavin monoamine oxidase family protein [Rhodospirillales bacterium]|nr:flavin monoamine oxidase family protein [Rhodospirillales bacterium]MDE2574122.1 flavin monoamine oxidase family protein [Rhodospirillales bacterium]
MADETAMRKRDLLALIGAAGGGAAMYFAMTALGQAAASDYAGPIRLDGDPKGASVLVLGAGVAGMVAALELRRAGYRVQVLEYNARAGGRTWTIRGGDTYTELGGATQHCDFADGLYLNPGPWRIPYHHRALLDYCRRLGVTLEPFIQVNHNAYLHARGVFGGKPQRLGAVQADFNGGIAELLAKATDQHALDATLTAEDAGRLLDSLRGWGALGADYRYRPGRAASQRRGWARPPGGGLTAEPIASQPLALADLLRAGFWRALATGMEYDYQTTLFQPVGGMDMVARGFVRAVGDLIRYNARVGAIHQDDRGVTVTYTDRTDGSTRQAHADWCVCTIPLSVLNQIDIQVGGPMKAAIAALPYAPGLKIGLQFRRRFWEEDEAIYGGISYTDLPVTMIGYPNTGYLADGPGVLLGAYAFGPYAYEFTALDPAARVARAVADGAQIHPQYHAEFLSGMAVGWHRVPWTMGCFGLWSRESRAAHYRDLCAIDGRIVLAGEHASYIPAWQEGAILSSLDAIARLHRRVVAP